MHIYIHKHIYIYIYICIYIYIYIYSIFIIQRVKARAIPCPHQAPTSGDNTVSVAATPSATKQLLPPDRLLRELYVHIYIYIYMCVYIYIYTPDQLRAETLIFIFSVQFVI